VTVWKWTSSPGSNDQAVAGGHAGDQKVEIAEMQALLPTA
jgi:hypothetical protein